MDAKAILPSKKAATFSAAIAKGSPSLYFSTLNSTTEKGRTSRIGFELDCKRCDEEFAQEYQANSMGALAWLEVRNYCAEFHSVCEFSQAFRSNPP